MKTALFPDTVITGELLERLRLPPEVTRTELVEGVLHVLTPTNRHHAEMTARLARLLGMALPRAWRVLDGDPGLYVRRRPDTVRGPDVLLISEDRYRETDPARAFVTVAPELVIEVISPSNEPEAIDTKVQEYLALGSTVWVVDLDTCTLTRFTPASPTGEICQTTVPLPDGGSLAMDAIFPVRA